MAKGQFNIATTGNTSSYISLTVEWEQVSNGSAANSSTLYISVFADKSSASTASTYGTANTEVRVSGCDPKYENGLSFSVAPGGRTTLFEKSFEVQHSEDGTRTIEIGVDVSGNVISGNGSRGKIVLDKIARAAQLLTAPNFNDEENPTITYSNPAGNAVDSVQMAILLPHFDLLSPSSTVSMSLFFTSV